MMNSFDAIFAGSKASDNTVSILPAPPDTELEYICDNDGFSEIAISGTIAARQNPNRIMFAQRDISGRQFVVFTRSIDLPFKVDNALFVTDLHTKYYVLNNPDQPNLAPAIMQYLPANITKELVTDPQAILSQGHPEVVIISFGNMPDALPRLAEARVRNIDIRPTQQGAGSVQFREKKGGKERFDPAQGESKYYGVTLLLGAIFSENKDYYECAIKKLHTKVQVVSQIYARRSALLETEIHSGICQASYGDAIAELEELRKISAGEYSMTPDDVNSQEVLRFADVKTNLQQLNEKVELHSCPLLY